MQPAAPRWGSGSVRRRAALNVTQQHARKAGLMHESTVNTDNNKSICGRDRASP